MPTLPHFSQLKKLGRKITNSSERFVVWVSAKLGHKRSVMLTQLSILLFIGLFLPSHHAHALPILIPLLWWGGAAVATYFGGKWVLSAIASKLLDALVFVAEMIFKLAGLFMTSMSKILDFSITFTINSDIYKAVSAIQVGWTAVRDLSNMFFIFVLLYIAILTILGMAGSNTKRWVASLVIAALLINFSLFITQVVVDAGNVLALGFWNKIIASSAPGATPSIGDFFAEGFRIQTTVDITDPQTGVTAAPSPAQKLEIFLGGAMVQFVAGYVFLAGAIMMIVRSVTLMVLMIASPFAFLGFALPKGGGFASQWLSKLIGATFLAPAFIFMLYIDALIIRGAEVLQASGADQSGMALAFAGVPSSFPVIYNFILMIILLLAALKVAHQVGGGVGASAGSWAKKAIGGGAAVGFAGAAMYGRQTFGSLGRGKMQDEKWVKEQNRLVAKGGMAGRMANVKLATAQSMSKGTFDARNAKVGGVGINSILGAAGTGVNVGQGSAKSFETHGQALSSLTGSYRGTAKEKELIDLAKSRLPNDPAAQKAFLAQRGVEIDKVDGKVDRNKALRETMDKEIAKKNREDENKEKLEGGVKDHAENNAKLAKLNAEKEELEKKGLAASAEQINAIKDTANAVESANEQIRKALLGTSGDDVAKLMNKPEYRDSAAVRANLTAKDYTAINKSYYDGGYDGATSDGGAAMMQQITVEALRSDKTPENVKKMIKNSMKNGTWGHEIDFKKQINEHLSSNASDTELNETWAMLDNDERADLKEALLHERVASRLSGATLGAINKKGSEGGYADVPDFREKLEELHKNGVLGSAAERNGINTAAAYVDKNAGKQESYFFGMPKKSQMTATAASQAKVDSAKKALSDHLASPDAWKAGKTSDLEGAVAKAEAAHEQTSNNQTTA